MELHAVSVRPIFQEREVRRDDDRGICSYVANDRRLRHQHIVLQSILNGLWSNKFSAGSLDQVLLTVGDAHEAIAIHLADVTSFKETIRGEGGPGLFRHVPITFENR